MASDLMSYLLGEKVAELEQDRAAMYCALQDAVADTVVLRFPNTPAALFHDVQFLNDLETGPAVAHGITRGSFRPT